MASVAAFVPGLNVPATAVEVGARLFEGGTSGALEASLGFIPGGRVVRGVGRLGIQNAPEILGRARQGLDRVASILGRDPNALLQEVLSGGKRFLDLRPGRVGRTNTIFQTQGTLVRATRGTRDDAIISVGIEQPADIFRRLETGSFQALDPLF